MNQQNIHQDFYFRVARFVGLINGIMRDLSIYHYKNNDFHYENHNQIHYVNHDFNYIPRNPKKCIRQLKKSTVRSQTRQSPSLPMHIEEEKKKDMNLL